MKEKIKILLKIIGSIIWVLGGGLLIASIIIGAPVLILLVLGIISIGLILKYIPQIIIVVVVSVLLVYGFTKKEKKGEEI